VQKLTNPVPFFLDARGDLLDGGSIYVGAANQDPELHPLTVYWNAALTTPAAQPLRTLGGIIVNGAVAGYVYFADGDYSFRVRDADGVQVTNITSAAALAGVATTYQPLSANLTTLAGTTTTAYGRGLLNLANQAALKAAVGIPAALPLSGGTVTGNIIRSGKGVHAYFADPAMTGGRIFITAVGAADPTSLPGDIWLTY